MSRNNDLSFFFFFSIYNVYHYHIFNSGEWYSVDVTLKVDRIKRNQFVVFFGRFSTADVVNVLRVDTC